MADEFPKLKRPSLILVTGLRFGGCVLFSRIVAAWAKCPWLSHKSVIDSLSKEAGYHIDNPPSEEEAARLLRLSFDIICSTALPQLSECVPTECVVIGSDLLSYKSQLLGLLNIMQRKLSGGNSRRLLIIECLRRDKFWWQRDADDEDLERSWYEPKSWKDVEKAILHHQQEGVLDAYFLTLLQDKHTPPTGVDAIKLVLDPNEDLTLRDFVPTSKKLEIDRRSLFVEAIKDLLTCDDVNSYGDGSHVVYYPLWRRQRLDEQGRTFASRVTTQHHWCPRRSDCIFRLTHNPIHAQQEEEATCEICDGKIQSTEQAYYCQFCSLSFHQACCRASPTMTAEKLSQLLDSIEDSYDGVFPAKTHACYSCIREGKGFSGMCESCIYRSVLKSRLVSPVLKHSCDQHHILTMSLAEVSKFWREPCTACGRGSDRNRYYCNICGSTYHMECLHLPIEMEHQHGGHLHRMKMEFSCTKEEEYEWCHACYKDINPKYWVYSCQECDYVAHLYCVFPFLSMRFLPPDYE